ncbi:mitochondrial carrier [Atractiella rhizophila]|nr:mitochondrial carrier [Atractiella rhizophila]
MSAAAIPLITSSSTDEEKFRKTFEAHAKTDKDGVKYLDQEGFVDAIAPPTDFTSITRRQFALLFRVASPKSPNRLSFEEFVRFETLLKQPDAEFQVAFRFFDLDGNGSVSFEEFQRVYAQMLEKKDAFPFDFGSPWLKLYLGKKHGTGEHVLGYNEFTQLMKGLQGERLRQAFQYFDKDEDGYIKAEDFKRIVIDLVKHKLSEEIVDQLTTLCNLSASGKISYSEARAFHNVIRDMDLVESVIREGCAKSKDGKISLADFQTIASQSTRYGSFSPLEARIVFHFASFGDPAKRLALTDFAHLIDAKWNRPIPEGITPTSGVINDILRSAYNFGLGGIAGGIGATFVYPIDLVKTRMQNQRSKVVGELLYKNSLDCAKKVYKNEGLRGFYRGLPPQLVGVAPEKAIKLTVNDLIRGKARDPVTGNIGLGWELIAGGGAGGCQVVFTNPLEIVKIRLQMQGEMAKKGGTAVAHGAGHIIKQLGLFGLYKGAGACLLRDIPFSAIYFPAYAHLKKDVFKEGHNGKKLGFGETLISAGIAGMPAAYLTTPADVVKTRLQTEARKGETNYKGIMDAFAKIYQEEGFKAFYKGGIARVVRSSPQFGVTLVAYEYLHKFIPIMQYPGDVQVTKIAPSFDELSRIRARNALRILLDVHHDVSSA